MQQLCMMMRAPSTAAAGQLLPNIAPVACGAEVLLLEPHGLTFYVREKANGLRKSETNSFKGVAVINMGFASHSVAYLVCFREMYSQSPRRTQSYLVIVPV